MLWSRTHLGWALFGMEYPFLVMYTKLREGVAAVVRAPMSASFEHRQTPVLQEGHKCTRRGSWEEVRYVYIHLR